MVEREQNKDDRRIIDIILTTKGKSMMEEQENAIKNAFKEILINLTDDELKEISAMLSKLEKIFSTSS